MRDAMRTKKNERKITANYLFVQGERGREPNVAKRLAKKRSEDSGMSFIEAAGEFDKPEKPLLARFRERTKASRGRGMRTNKEGIRSG